MFVALHTCNGLFTNRRIHKWHALVKSVQLSDAESKQLQVSVQEKFQVCT